MPIEIRQIPCLSDNYGYLVRDATSGLVASIDTPDPKAINETLESAGWKLTHILNTHHHYDHAGGNLALKEKWSCEIIGPRGEQEKIPGIDRAVGDGDTIALGATTASVLDTPGHTAGHVIYHFKGDNVAFVGDTIFAMGCGRLFEGTPDQMWASLQKISAMPPETKLYCAHEYTKANAAFALSVDPDNSALQRRAVEVDAMREINMPTIPTTVGQELATNPFLRPNDPDLQKTIGLIGAATVDVFAKTRTLKDAF